MPGCDETMLQHGTRIATLAQSSMVACTVGRLTWKRPMSYCTPVLSPSCLRDAKRGDARVRGAHGGPAACTRPSHAPFQLRLRQRAHIPPQRGLHPVGGGRQAVLAPCVVRPHVPGGAQPPRQAGLVDSQVVGDRPLHRQHAQRQRHAGGAGRPRRVRRGTRGKHPPARAPPRVPRQGLCYARRAPVDAHFSPVRRGHNAAHKLGARGRRVSRYGGDTSAPCNTRAFHSGRSWVPRLATSS